MDISSDAQQLISDKLLALDNLDFVPVVFHASLIMHHDWVQLLYELIFNDTERVSILNTVSLEEAELAAQVALRLSNIDLDCDTDDCRQAITTYIERFGKRP